MGAVLLGIDIGTSSCKATAFDECGGILADAVASYPLYTPRPGFAEQEPDDWWQGAVDAVKDVLAQLQADGRGPGDIAAVGVDGQSWACVPVSQDGETFGRTPIWMDTRSQAEADALVNIAGLPALMDAAGNRPAAGHTGPKALWMAKHQPDRLRRASFILQSNGFIVYKLTGRPSHDRSQGYGWACYNMARGAWDIPFGKSLGLPVHLLPDLYDCHQVVGGVSSSAAALTGLLAGTPVVAGGLDAACGTLGAGVVAPGQTQEQGGNAGGFSACLSRPTTHEKLILSAHVAPGCWLLQGGTVGGSAAARWCRRLLGSPSYEDMDALAATVPRGSRGVTFLPYLSGERSPLWDPAACGVFFGLSLASQQAEVWRAMLEGVAFALLHNLQTAEEAGVCVGDMRAVGGAARSPVWTQIKADITGRRMEVARPGAATSQGAAMLAGMGVGVWPSFAEAVRRTTFVERSHDPTLPCDPAYERAYARYRALYPALRELMRAAHEEAAP